MMQCLMPMNELPLSKSDAAVMVAGTLAAVLLRCTAIKLSSETLFLDMEHWLAAIFGISEFA